MPADFHAGFTPIGREDVSLDRAEQSVNPNGPGDGRHLGL